MKKTTLLIAGLSIALPASSLAYPNGTPQYVTDAAPFCASCHSSVKAEYMPELPPDLAEKELPEAKHYGMVRMGAPPSPYIELTKDEKERLIKAAKEIDANSRVTVSAPGRTSPGSEIKVTVSARGGNGPVIGVMLVDSALRYQARPIASEGWLVTAEPEVKGQDGKKQTDWLDKRRKGAPRNLSFVLIERQRSDPANGVYPEGTIVFTLKAPAKPGAYTVTAALLYGTENTDKAGFFQRPSGRILFSEEKTVMVE